MYVKVGLVCKTKGIIFHDTLTLGIIFGTELRLFLTCGHNNLPPPRYYRKCLSGVMNDEMNRYLT